MITVCLSIAKKLIPSTRRRMLFVKWAGV